jgi:tape measure domain-containing protein
MRDIELRLTADVDGATKEVAGFKKEFADMVKVVEKPLRQINTFRDLESSVANTGKAMREARDRVRDLAGEIGRAEIPSKQLQEAYKASVRELERLSRVEAVQLNQLAAMREGLRAAGVDTRNLAAEQARLSAEYSKAVSAGRSNAALGSAKSSLGVGAVRDAQQELVKLRQQYALVTSSGELSARDLGIAQANYRRSVSDTLAKLRELRAAARAPAPKPDTSVASARQNLGVEQYRALRVQLTSLSADYARLTRQGVLSAQERSVAEANYRRKVDETKRAIADLSSASGKSGGGITASGALGIVGGVGAATAVFSEYTKASDSVKKMDAQLRLATQSQTEFNIAQSATREIAARSQAPLEDVVTLYSRLSPALSAMGRGQSDTLKVIDAVTQSLRISGATTSETSSTITQFSQALGSGVLRGEEFNSIAENSPRLLRALADGFKVPTGQLRAMAAAGELTSEAVTQVVIDALPKLQEEAAVLPETVGGAFTVMGDKITLALGSVDTGPLIQQIRNLGDTVADPKVANNLNRLGAVVLKFAALIPKGLSGLVEIGDDIGYQAAKLTGQVSPLDKVERDIKAAEEALKGFNVTTLFTADDDTILNMFYSKAALEKKLQEFKAYRAQLLEQAKGMAAEQVAAQQDGQKSEVSVDEQKLNDKRTYFNSLRDLQKDALASTKASVSAQVSVERNATSALKKAKDEQLKTQQKYADALASIGTTSGGGDYSSAQSLKVSARQALQRGDVEGAKRQADDALDILKKLSDAGQNTYGFSGFIKELKGIEDAADKINVDKAQDSVDAAKTKLSELKTLIDEVKNFVITPTMSEDGRAKFLADVKRLGELAGQQFNIPAEPVQAAEVNSPAPAQPATLAQPSQPAATSAANPPTTAVPAKTSGLKYQPGVTDYSQQSLGVPPVAVPVEPAIDPAALARANELVKAASEEYRQRLTVPVVVDPTAVQGVAEKLNVPVKTALDDVSAQAATAQVAALAESFRKELTIAVSVSGVNGGATPTDSESLPGYAAGDMVRGAGTGTSDSILARLSNGEFVMQAAAVRHYGPELLRQINERRLPRFATGGEVGRSLPHIPAPGEALLNRLNPPVPQPYGSVALTVGGDTYHMQAPQESFEKMIRKYRVKFGRT